MKLLHPFLSIGCLLILAASAHSKQIETINCPATADVSYAKDTGLMSGQSGTYVFEGSVLMINGVTPELTAKVSPTLKAEQIVGVGSFELTCSYKIQQNEYKNKSADLKITINEYKNCKIINQKSFECEKF